MTVTIQIGNSDDKLKQTEWSAFVYATHKILEESEGEIHFSATSEGSCPWQNACWVFEMDRDRFIRLMIPQLQVLCRHYKQDSIAVTVGKTQFITPVPE